MCPLLLQVVRSSKAYILSALSTTLYEGTLDWFDHIEKDIVPRVDGSDASQRLRAFYCIERIAQELVSRPSGEFYHVVAGALLPKTNPDTASVFFAKAHTKEFPRSHAGLTELIEHIDDWERFIVVEAEELKILNPRMKGVEQMQVSQLSTAEKVFGNLRQLALLLRKNLREINPSDMALIGELFVTALTTIGTYPHHLVEHVGQLMCINSTGTYVKFDGPKS